MLLDLFVAHLPAFYFFPNPACLPLHGLHLNRDRVRLGLANSLDELFELQLSPPRILKLLLEPQRHRSHFS